MIENNSDQYLIDNFLKNFNKPQNILLIRIPSINYETFNIEHQKKAGYMTYQPISITTLAATLREKIPNLNIKLLDLEYETLKIMFETGKKDNVMENIVQKTIQEFKPDMVGLSVVFSVGINNGISVMKQVKSFNKKTMVIFGGVHCTFDFERIISEGSDMVFLKEADITFPAFIKYARKETNFNEDIHGFVMKYNDSFKKIEYKKYPDFKNLPMPAWDMIDTRKYHEVSSVCGLKNVINEKAPTAIIQTLRGCVARCTFCSVRNFNGFGTRTRTTEDVVNEIEYLVKNYGVKYLEVVDDDFTADLKRANEICREIVKRKIDITWSLDNGIRLLTITEELAENLVASGCKLISVGVESGDKKILHKIKKPLTIPGLYKKMEMMDKYPEIYIKGNFIVGFPFENYEQLQNTYKVASEIDFDWIVLSIYSPLIGTEAIGYMDNATQDEIRYNESNYGTVDFIPDGFKSINDFNNDVYVRNLKYNFIENPNFLGKKGGHRRAVKDFKRILEQTDTEHAVAMYCLSKLGNEIGEKQAKDYYDRSLKIIKNSEKWKFFFDKLGIISSTTGDFVFPEFRSGRELDGERLT